MESCELVAEALGEHVFDFFLRNKRTEWANYRSHVTPFELQTYLVAVIGPPVLSATGPGARPDLVKSALPSWS